MMTNPHFTRSMPVLEHAQFTMVTSWLREDSLLTECYVKNREDSQILSFRRRRRENLRAQAQAFMPASCNHLILFLAKILPTKLATTSGSLQLCPEIIYNILVVPEFIQSCFKRVSSFSRHNPVWQSLPVFTARLVKPNLHYGVKNTYETDTADVEHTSQMTFYLACHAILSYTKLHSITLNDIF